MKIIFSSPTLRLHHERIRFVKDMAYRKKKLWPFKYICHTFGLRVEQNRQFKDRFGTDVIYDVTGKSGKSNDVT